MARRAKHGLVYFPFDVDFFQDLKIRKLIKSQGGKAIAVYTLLLCIIYRDGYYVKWDEELPFVISEQTGYDEVYIREVIKYCMKIGLLSSELLNKEGILTSRGIQERYMNINKLCKRVSTVNEYSLMPESSVTEKASVKEEPVKDEAITANPMADEIEQLKKDGTWLEYLQMNYHTSVDVLMQALDEFCVHCLSDGKDTAHSTLRDAKQHFNNWFRIKQQFKDDSNREKQKDRRRGSMLKANEEKTYSGAF